VTDDGPYIVLAVEVRPETFRQLILTAGDTGAEIGELAADLLAAAVDSLDGIADETLPSETSSGLNGGKV
jgi:hypothetical protein